MEIHLLISSTVKKAVGKVVSIKVTRSGLVLVNCVDEEQKNLALDLPRCIDLRSRAPAKGVIAGVSLDVDNEYLSQKIQGVACARRLTLMVNGRENSLSIFLLFEETLPEYVRYVVRTFVSKPLQCGNGKGYGCNSIASVPLLTPTWA